MVRCSGVVAVSERQTVKTDPENWKKYCTLKSRMLLDFGKPELTFTEFANICMALSNPTIEHVLALRKQKGERRR